MNILTGYRPVEDNERNSEEVILISNDKKKTKTQLRNILMAGLIADMIEEEDEEDPLEEIPVPLMNEATTKMVIQYGEQHWNNPARIIERPLQGDFRELVSEWDFKFVDDLSVHEAVSLLKASTYLNIQSLTDLVAARKMSSMKGQSPEQIRNEFGIANDFTEEEQAMILEASQWNTKARKPKVTDEDEGEME